MSAAGLLSQPESWVLQKARGPGRILIRGIGLATAPIRPLPDFLIIGAKRGGTTSVYYHLLDHPQVVPLFPRADHLPKANHTKGVHYFDVNYHRGERWYRSNFPSTRVRIRTERRLSASTVTGEASPYYLFHPQAPARAAALIPEARLIAILRDPVDRTYSHWKERRREGVEHLSFEEALDVEAERLRGAEERLCSDPEHYSYAHEHLSYASQSEYGPMLERWLAHYPREQLLVVASEDYYADPSGTLRQISGHLGLATHELGGGAPRNAAPGEELAPRLRRSLAARFASSNEQVERIVGRTLRWA